MVCCVLCVVWCVICDMWCVVSTVGPTPHVCLDNSLCLQVFVQQKSCYCSIERRWSVYDIIDVDIVTRTYQSNSLTAFTGGSVRESIFLPVPNDFSAPGDVPYTHCCRCRCRRCCHSDTFIRYYQLYSSKHLVSLCKATRALELRRLRLHESKSVGGAV